jgi:hypothetical protein
MLTCELAVGLWLGLFQLLLISYSRLTANPYTLQAFLDSFAFHITNNKINICLKKNERVVCPDIPVQLMACLNTSLTGFLIFFFP